MSDLLVCVGGGGQHIALAVARMVRLGVWKRVPKVAVLDAERTAPLNQRLLNFAAPQGAAAAGASARTHPLGRFDFKAPFEVMGLPPTFREVFLEKKTDLAEELYELFYPEMADAVNIHVGMFAQPAVGAAMFAARAESFLDPVLTGGIQSSEKIMVAGSMVGGTGAGILHLLVDYLARHRERGNRELLGAFLLEWFNLPAGVVSAASDVTLVNSANHGVDYLARHTYKRLRRTILVGANNVGPQKVDADATNDETVSIFPLLAAYGLTTIRGDTVSKDDNAVYGLTTAPSDPRCLWLLGERWNTGEEGNSIGVQWKAAQVVQRAVRVIAEHRSEFDGLTGTGVKDKWEKLGGGWEWGNAISAAATLAGVRRAEDLAPQVLNALLARMGEVDFVTAWLDKVFGTPSLSAYGSQRLMDLFSTPMTKQYAFDLLERSIGPGRESFNTWLGARAGKDSVAGGLSPTAAAERIATIMEGALLAAVMSS